MRLIFFKTSICVLCEWEIHRVVSCGSTYSCGDIFEIEVKQKNHYKISERLSNRKYTAHFKDARLFVAIVNNSNAFPWFHVKLLRNEKMSCVL